MSPTSTDLISAYLGACEDVQLSEAEQEQVGDALIHALAEARDKYAGVDFPGQEFAAYLGARMKGTSCTAKEIAARATADIYLAAACVAGDRTALSLLDSQVLSALPIAMSRLKLNSAAIDEAIQRARAKLLVGRDGEGKLADFSGTGDLRGWVKVIAIRDALRTARKEQREVSLSDELESVLPATALDPDLAYQRRLYRAEFKASFEAAVDELSARERSLLRQSIVYNATVDQVAVVYQVHRATAARWVSKAREHLATKTRSHLRKRLKLSESQFQSVVRLIESQMDLSVERLLATDGSDEQADEQQDN